MFFCRAISVYGTFVPAIPRGLSIAAKGLSPCLFRRGFYILPLSARAGASPFVKWFFMEYFHSNSIVGVSMPRYLSQHTLACLTRQGAETLAQRMQGGGPACADRVLVNMLEGKMFAEFRSDSRETLEAWLKAEGMHYDWVVRIEWETRNGKLEIAD
jgi:hypothetical protein